MSKKRVRFPDGKGGGSGECDGDNDHNSEDELRNGDPHRPPLSVVVGTVPHRDDWTDEERGLMFFTRSEYNSSRSTAKVISKESERYGFSKTLDGTYIEKSAEAQEKLNEWVQQGGNRRGLERWANADHGEKRQHDQFHAIMAVLRAQDEMIARKNSIDVEKLRKVSHKATKVSRHFARMIGKADSYAMAQELRADSEAAAAEAGTKSGGISTTDDTASVTASLSGMTVGSEEMTVNTLNTYGDVTVPSVDTNEYQHEPIDLDTDLLNIDKVGKNGGEKHRKRRFGFGGRMKNRDGNGNNGSSSKAERISRVA